MKTMRRIPLHPRFLEDCMKTIPRLAALAVIASAMGSAWAAPTGICTI